MTTTTQDLTRHETTILAIALQDHLSAMHAHYTDPNPFNDGLRHNTLDAAEATLALLRKLHTGAADGWVRNHGNPWRDWAGELAAARRTA